MTCGFEETIRNTLIGNGPDQVTIKADVTWKNLGLWKKYRLADLSVIGNQNMIINPWFNLTGKNYRKVYEHCSIRKIPDDALVYAITARYNDADTGVEQYGSNFQWGLYNGQKVVFCRPCCDLYNIYVYAFKWLPVADGNYGLVIYGSDGTVIYNSNFKYLKVKYTSWNGYGQRFISKNDKQNVAVTMPFNSVSFRGNFSNFSDARYFLTSYGDNGGELQGVLLGGGLNEVNLTDTYYFGVVFTQVDVSNL